MARGLLQPLNDRRSNVRNLSDLELYAGAGDGNRTRTISLGIKRERPLSAPRCYSCTSGPRKCPRGAPESCPVQQVCETNVRGNYRIVRQALVPGTWPSSLAKLGSWIGGPTGIGASNYVPAVMMTTLSCYTTVNPSGSL